MNDFMELKELNDIDRDRESLDEYADSINPNVLQYLPSFEFENLIDVLDSAIERLNSDPIKYINHKSPKCCWV